MLETDPLLQIGLAHYLILSAMVFTIGLLTVLMRKNLIVILMGIELMLNGVNISFVAFSYFTGNISGLAMVFFVMTIAAAEAGVGLALAVTVFKKYREVSLPLFEKMKG